MNISFEYDETRYELRQLIAPGTSLGKPYPWIAYLCPKGMLWQGGQGRGATPQAAVDDMIRQLEERVARKVQTVYNGPKTSFSLELDLNF